jgi:hypothetical protein
MSRSFPLDLPEVTGVAFLHQGRGEFEFIIVGEGKGVFPIRNIPFQGHVHVVFLGHVEPRNDYNLIAEFAGCPRQRYV